MIEGMSRAEILESLPEGFCDDCWQQSLDRRRLGRCRACISSPKGGELGTDLNRDQLVAALVGQGVLPVRQVSISDAWSASRFRTANEQGARPCEQDPQMVPVDGLAHRTRRLRSARLPDNR